MRIMNENIKSIRTKNLQYELRKNQYWCETPKSFEIWEHDNGLDSRIHRISKSNISFVHAL